MQWGVTITDCTFSDSSAFSYGGAVYLISGYNDVVVSDSLFTRTSAAYGGAMLFNSDNMNFALSGCIFDKTSASTDGGAIILLDII